MKLLLSIFLMSTFLYACKQNTNDQKQTTVIDEIVKVESNMNKRVKFSSKDGVEIIGDLYLTDDIKNPFILLFHQAGSGRGEYIEIAPQLKALGFNCLAIDQRSGKEANGIVNETNSNAVAQNKSTEYVDAMPDLEASLSYIEEAYHPEKLILWGSSYSASLVFILANQYKNKIDALLAFSPGEYFTFKNKEVKSFAKKIDIPVFITSAKNEKKAWEEIYNSIPSDNKVSYLPEDDGRHGSSALWSSNNSNKDYWAAVTKFLEELK